MLSDAQHIKQVVLPLTTYCNLKCPECIANIPSIDCSEHYSREYIERAASCLEGVEQLHISGGEATLHPEFRQLVPLFKKWFNCRILSLVTNGARVRRYADILHYFDKIFISHYLDNQKDVEFISSHFHDSEAPGPTLHVCMARRAVKPLPCSRAYQVKYMYGRLYPCCVIPRGLEDRGICLEKSWREDILKVDLPCEFCCFAEEGASLQYLESDDLPEASEEGITSNRQRIAAWPILASAAIRIYGLDLDSWMSREAILRLQPPRNVSGLHVVFESHAPQELYPISLTFENMRHQTVHRCRVTKGGTSETVFPLSRGMQIAAEELFKIRCDKTFVPSQISSVSLDRRELGVRIVMLRYI